MVSVPDYLSIAVDPVRLAILGSAARGPVDVEAISDDLGVDGVRAYRESLERALDKTEAHRMETRWSDAANHPAEALPTDPDWAGRCTYSQSLDRSR